jgi:hypothetical protein
MPIDMRHAHDLLQEYELIHHLPQIRQEHTEYIAKFSSTLDEIRLHRGQQVSLPVAQEVANVVLHGLRLLGSWSGRIKMQSAWKYSRPNMDVQPKEGEELSNYERVCLARAHTLSVVGNINSLTTVYR